MSDGRGADLSRREFLAAASALAAALPAGAAVAAAAAPPKSPDPSRPPGSPEPPDSLATDVVPFAEAVARALRGAGARVVTNVPATACSELYDAWSRLEGKEPVYSFNEEVAFAVAHGAALVGTRSAAIFKSHGLAKAGNAVVDSLTALTAAGFVVVVSDDPAGSHSDNVFDGEALLKGFGLPYARTTAGTVYRDVTEAFARSEATCAPVAVLFDAAEASRPARAATLASIEERARVLATGGHVLAPRDVHARVLCPPLAPFQARVRQAQREGKEWRAMERPPLPVVPGGLPPRWQAPAARYVPLFTALRRLRKDAGIGFVSGDAGLGVLFAFPPFGCVDVCTYYGGSLPLATGAWMAGEQRPWAVAGDFAFLAGGGLGLAEATQRGAPLKVLLLYNGKAETTGGQKMAPGVFDQVLGGYRSIARTLHHPEDEEASYAALREAHEAPGPRIVVADYV